MIGIPFAGILSFLTGLPIKQAIQSWENVQTEKAKLADNESTKVHDERQKEIEAEVQVMVQMAKQRIFTAFIIFLSLPAALIIWQYIVFDKIVAPWFGGHRTDDLSPALWDYVKMVLGYWFLRSVVTQWSAWRGK